MYAFLPLCMQFPTFIPRVKVALADVQAVSTLIELHTAHLALVAICLPLLGQVEPWLLVDVAGHRPPQQHL